MKNFLIIILFTTFFLFKTGGLSAQHIFKEKFKDCNTEHFIIESDSVTIKMKNDLLPILKNNFKKENIKNLRGFISLQILINEKGESCLLSIENRTNFKTQVLKLKKIVDNELKWEQPEERVSAIVAIKFLNKKLELKRLGFNTKKGFHELIN